MKLTRIGDVCLWRVFSSCLSVADLFARSLVQLRFSTVCSPVLHARNINDLSHYPEIAKAHTYVTANVNKTFLTAAVAADALNMHIHSTVFISSSRTSCHKCGCGCLDLVCRHTVCLICYKIMAIGLVVRAGLTYRCCFVRAAQSIPKAQNTAHFNEK